SPHNHRERGPGPRRDWSIVHVAVGCRSPVHLGSDRLVRPAAHTISWRSSFMRDLMTSMLHRLRTGWFWPLVLLALPNCTFQVGGLGPLPNLNPGPLPHTSAIMCDIEKFQGTPRRCATAADLANGIRLEDAAVALVSGQRANVGLDFSAAAAAHCGAGNAEAIDFQGSFPDGFAVCLNCGAAIPAFHADATAVC